MYRCRRGRRSVVRPWRRLVVVRQVLLPRALLSVFCSSCRYKKLCPYAENHAAQFLPQAAGKKARHRRMWYCEMASSLVGLACPDGTRKIEGRKQKAVGRRQKAQGSRQ